VTWGWLIFISGFVLGVIVALLIGSWLLFGVIGEVDDLLGKR